MLVIGEGVIALALSEIDVGDIVEAKGLVGLVTKIALHLERIFVELEGLVELALALEEDAHVDQGVGLIFLGANFAVDVDGLFEAGHGIVDFAGEA